MFNTHLISVLLAAAALALPASGCKDAPNIHATGSYVVKEYNLDAADFSQLSVTGPIPVDVYQAEKCSVTLIVNDNLFQYVRFNKIVDVVRISLEPVSFKNLNISLAVGLPSLRSLAITTAGSCTLHDFNLKETCEITVSQGSTAVVNLAGDQYVSIFATSGSTVAGTLKCGDARLAASGASRLSLAGQCDYAIVDAAGASQLSLADCWLGNAEAMVRGVSSAVINVGGKLSVDVSGASTLSYGGNPSLGKVMVAAGSKLIRR